MLGIYHDIEIKGAAKQIMEAVTTPEGFNSWWTLKCSGDINVGALFNFYFSPDYDWYATVGEYMPDSKVTYEMSKTSPDWEETRLSFAIINKPDKTRLLRFEHIGWKALTDNYRVTSYCWVNYLNNLKRFIEEGISTPYTPKV